MPTVLCHVFLACFYSNFEYYLQNFGISNTEGAIRLHGVDFSLTWGWHILLLILNEFYV